MLIARKICTGVYIAKSNKFILYTAYTSSFLYNSGKSFSLWGSLIFLLLGASGMQKQDDNRRKAECSSPEQYPGRRVTQHRPTPVPRWSNESKIKEGMRRTTLCELRLQDIEERLQTLMDTSIKLCERIETLEEDIKRTHETTRLLVDTIDTM